MKQRGASEEVRERGLDDFKLVGCDPDVDLAKTNFESFFIGFEEAEGGFVVRVYSDAD